jgi:hypothetical protein
MSPTRTGLGWLLTRALVLPVAALLAAAAYLVCSGAFAAGPGGSPEARTTTDVDSTWKASYSRQFPGCVAVVLWPDDERPEAVVVRLPSGDVVRISRQAASHGALQHDRYEDARIIGACYAR